MISCDIMMTSCDVIVILVVMMTLYDGIVASCDVMITSCHDDNIMS